MPHATCHQHPFNSQAVLPLLFFLAMASFTYSGKDEERVPKEAESLTIAEAVKALPVRFCSHSKLRKVEFSPNSGIQSIPNETCFGCSALREVVVPSTLTAIEAFAFNSCPSLANFYSQTV